MLDGEILVIYLLEFVCTYNVKILENSQINRCFHIRRTHKISLKVKIIYLYNF